MGGVGGRPLRRCGTGRYVKKVEHRPQLEQGFLELGCGNALGDDPVAGIGDGGVSAEEGVAQSGMAISYHRRRPPSRSLPHTTRSIPLHLLDEPQRSTGELLADGGGGMKSRRQVQDPRRGGARDRGWPGAAPPGTGATAGSEIGAGRRPAARVVRGRRRSPIVLETVPWGWRAKPRRDAGPEPGIGAPLWVTPPTD